MLQFFFNFCRSPSFKVPQTLFWDVLTLPRPKIPMSSLDWPLLSYRLYKRSHFPLFFFHRYPKSVLALSKLITCYATSIHLRFTILFAKSTIIQNMQNLFLVYIVYLKGTIIHIVHLCIKPYKLLNSTRFLSLLKKKYHQILLVLLFWATPSSV